MFKRLKDDDAGTSRSSTSPSHDADHDDIETLLRRLDEVARANGGDGSASLRRIAEEVEEHAEVLSATVSARQEAQTMLALAMTERDKASADGAAIIEEARGVAARLTREAQTHAEDSLAEVRRWATAQRSSVEQTVAELTDAAQREADEIREDANENAMSEATRAAEVYVARAAAVAIRDAEQHRTDAAQVLDRTAEAVTAAQATVAGFTETLGAFVAEMSGHLETLQGVVAEAEEQRAAAAELPPIAVDPQSWAETDLVLLPLDPGGDTPVAPEPTRDAVVEQPEVDDVDEEPELDDEPEADDVADEDASSDEDVTDEAEPVEVAEEPAPRKKAPARQRTTGTTARKRPPAGGRPLGSMYRDRD